MGGRHAAVFFLHWCGCCVFGPVWLRGCRCGARPESRRAARSQQHAARRVRQPATPQRLPAHHLSSGQSVDRLYRTSRWHPRRAETRQSADRAGRIQRYFDRGRTDPAHPKYLHHIPVEEGLDEQGGAQMARVCSGLKSDPSKVYLLRTFGNSAHEIWNVTDPANPALVTRISGIKGTHKNFWECDTGIAYIVSGAPDWRTNRMTQVYDLSDPAHPVKIRDFGLVGQQPGATGPVPAPVHGMISVGPQGNRIYFGYGTNKGGVVQIIDRQKLLQGPKEPTPDNLRYPVVGQFEMSPLNGAHTTFPLGPMPISEFAKDHEGSMRNMIMVVDE